MLYALIVNTIFTVYGNKKIIIKIIKSIKFRLELHIIIITDKITNRIMKSRIVNILKYIAIKYKKGYER